MVDNGASVGPGGTLNVSSGGTDSGTSVTGGTMNVSSGGTADATSVGSGGTMNVSSGGTASGASVGSGGTLTVSAGGVVSALTINDPNDQSLTAVVNVLSGGTVDGTTKIDGGQLILDAGATFEPNAKLTIINTGELVLEQDSFKGTIHGFGGQDFMDLTKIRFIGQGPDATTATFTQTNGAGGLLQVAQGNHVADLHLAGTYTTANFALQSDGIARHDGCFCSQCCAAGARVADIIRRRSCCGAEAVYRDLSGPPAIAAGGPIFWGQTYSRAAAPKCYAGDSAVFGNPFLSSRRKSEFVSERTIIRIIDRLRADRAAPAITLSA